MCPCSYGFDGLYWLIIIIGAPIMIGLTMDYDMFLITKIFELRQDGYSTRFAILSGEYAVCHKCNALLMAICAS